MARYKPRYTAAELEKFKEYVDKRALYRPLACTGGDHCWVTLGPPGIGSHGQCVECKVPPASYPNGVNDHAHRKQVK